MKLHQLIPVIEKVRSTSKTAISKIYAEAQKKDWVTGLIRTFQPVADDGYVYPDESKKLIAKSEDFVNQFIESISESYDLVFAQESANQSAKADIVVDGQTVLTKRMGYKPRPSRAALILSIAAT